MSADEIPEVTPQKVSDDIEVVLLFTAGNRDAAGFVRAFTEMGGQSAESLARQALSHYYDGDHNRFAGLVRVRIPRSLMRERWGKAVAS